MILHLKDGRRILGWPEGWPPTSAEGYFLLTKPYQLGPAIREEKLRSSSALVLPMADVSWIQLISEEEAARLR